MRTAEERIEALHSRMENLQQAKERRIDALLGAGCGMLTILLAALIFVNGSSNGATAGIYSGATMLLEDAGGYVLAAVAAFMVGVIVTAVILGARKRQKNQAEKED